MEKLNVRIKWLSNASFEIEKNGVTVVTDPYIDGNKNSPCTYESVENCDYITLSHCHWDHIPEILPLYEKFKPVILCGSLTAEPLCEWGDLNPYYVYPMDSNLELDFDTVKIKALFGNHVNLKNNWSVINDKLSHNDICDERMAKIQAMGNLEYRNFLFTYPDGLKLLMWGNNLVPMQRNILKAEKPDIAVMQATGQIKDPEKFADFVAAFGPKIVIPHHMDLSKPMDAVIPKLLEVKEAVERKSPGTTFVIPVHGEWMEL